MAPRNRQPCVCYFEDDEEEWARLALLRAEFDRTLEMVAQMEAGAEQQMPASVPVPAPLHDWP